MKRRTTALASTRIDQRFIPVRTEGFEIYSQRKKLRTDHQAAQPSKRLLNVEKSRLFHRENLTTWRFFESSM
ncbi:hypothetical protein HK14_00540 [Acetobacter cibinongensis]|uniref:Uncharacterized protein n=1 Tax=Acetobacter cibinongensis TaxID=146475 RepID=A0A1Z5YZ69_9PROT|nr:hypothetical protein HK14_00540 [Acetobacter cibinongensis]